MIATGGVDLTTIRAYFEAGAVAVGMGSRLLNRDWIRAGDFGRLTENARRYVEIVRSLT
jgi:2-dehydro-3-deoxyphosphogluconate aldolase/(4S)-4-hydroxy-2-oxoglutarate aldolase